MALIKFYAVHPTVAVNLNQQFTIVKGSGHATYRYADISKVCCLGDNGDKQ